MYQIFLDGYNIKNFVSVQTSVYNQRLKLKILEIYSLYSYLDIFNIFVKITIKHRFFNNHCIILIVSSDFFILHHPIVIITFKHHVKLKTGIFGPRLK